MKFCKLYSLFLLASPVFAASELFVSASAGPGGDGTSAKPFATIDEAREAARTLPEAPVTVRIRGGHYLLRDGMAWSAADSGGPHRRITYRGEPGETVRISSGVVVPASALQPVTDEKVRARFPEEVRDRVRQVQLKDLGITTTPPPDNFRGLELLEVFWNGSRLPLARWPGHGGFARMERVTDNGMSRSSPGTFVYREDQPGLWQEAVSEGLWLRGFWRVPWVIEAVRVGSIDPEARSITLAVPVSGGIGSKYHRKNGVGAGSGDEPWEAINLIEEINSPGEWAVRFSENIFYILPPEGAGELLISDHKKPVLALTNVSHVSLENLSVDSGLGDGIRIEGGEDVLLAGCKVANVARSGIVVRGGKNHTVLSCDITGTGLSGIAYLGGERRTLTPGNHRILNNIVTRAGGFFPSPGIDGGLGTQAESVGNLVAHNRIHDCANSGIVYSGNDNVFELNEIYRVGLGSSDLGCFYTTGQRC